jgi:hypothetical protein
LWNCEARVVGRDSFGQELDGDRLIEREVVRAIHAAHATTSQQRDEASAAGDHGTGRGPARRRRAQQRWFDPDERVGHGGILLEE